MRIHRPRCAAAALCAGGIASLLVVGSGPAARAEVGPQLIVTSVANGHNIPWDVAFAHDGTMLFDERYGAIRPA